MTESSYIPLLGLLVGLVLGYVHFASLKRITALYLRGEHVARAVLLQLGRLALLALVMLVLARQGAMPLLAGALGVLLSRTLVLRREKRRDERPNQREVG